MTNLPDVLKALDALYQFSTNVTATLAAHSQAQSYYQMIRSHLTPPVKGPVEVVGEKKEEKKAEKKS